MSNEIIAGKYGAIFVDGSLVWLEGTDNITCMASVPGHLMLFSRSGEVYYGETATAIHRQSVVLDGLPTHAIAWPMPGTMDVLVGLGEGKLAGYSAYIWHTWQVFDQSSAVYATAVLTEAERASFSPDQVFMIAVGGGGDIAVANGYQALPGWKEWTRLPNLPVTLMAACRGDGMWLVGGEGGRLFTTSDLVNWMEVDAGMDGSCIYRLKYDPVSGFIAVGAENKISTSFDGYIWTVQQPPETASSGYLQRNRWLSAAPTASGWVVVGDDGNKMAIDLGDGYYYASEPVFYMDHYTTSSLQPFVRFDDNGYNYAFMVCYWIGHTGANYGPIKLRIWDEDGNQIEPVLSFSNAPPAPGVNVYWYTLSDITLETSWPISDPWADSSWGEPVMTAMPGADYGAPAGFPSVDYPFYERVSVYVYYGNDALCYLLGRVPSGMPDYGTVYYTLSGQIRYTDANGVTTNYTLYNRNNPESTTIEFSRLFYPPLD